jgi:hypothetical protein
LSHLNRFFIFAFLLALISCKKTEKKRIVIDSSWHKLILSSGWMIWAPADFRSKTEPGIDSSPGIIYSKKDSIFLQYDSGPFERNSSNSSCDLKSNFQDATASIDTGFYKTFYKIPVRHKAYIDTIDDKVAIVVRPVKTGKGTVGIEILGCRQEAWIGIKGTNLNSEKEKLVLEIYKTLKQANK